MPFFRDAIVLDVACMGHTFNEHLLCNRSGCDLSWSDHQSAPTQCMGSPGGTNPCSLEERAVAAGLYRSWLSTKGSRSVPEVGAGMGLSPEQSRRAYDRARRWVVGAA